MKKKPVDTTPEFMTQACLAARTRLLNRVITKIYDDALRPLGIKTSQLNILVVTAQLDSAPPAEICEQLKMDISTVSRSVGRMRARGWIQVVEDEKDARAHQFRLSAKGQRLLDKARPAWDKAQEKVRELLGPDGVEALVEAAEKVRARA